jgi:hypothetical protein
MPIGVDPHDYQPSARQAASLREADLVVAWGLNLEEGLTDVLATACGRRRACVGVVLSSCRSRAGDRRSDRPFTTVTGIMMNTITTNADHDDADPRGSRPRPRSAHLDGPGAHGRGGGCSATVLDETSIPDRLGGPGGPAGGCATPGALRDRGILTRDSRGTPEARHQSRLPRLLRRAIRLRSRRGRHPGRLDVGRLHRRPRSPSWSSARSGSSGVTVLSSQRRPARTVCSRPSQGRSPGSRWSRSSPDPSPRPGSRETHSPACSSTTPTVIADASGRH